MEREKNIIRNLFSFPGYSLFYPRPFSELEYTPVVVLSTQVCMLFTLLYWQLAPSPTFRPVLQQIRKYWTVLVEGKLFTPNIFSQDLLCNRLVILSYQNMHFSHLLVTKIFSAHITVKAICLLCLLDALKVDGVTLPRHCIWLHFDKKLRDCNIHSYKL